jgi:hypothetical protein
MQEPEDWERLFADVRRKDDLRVGCAGLAIAAFTIAVVMLLKWAL